jgi:hypothetical protein
MTTSDEPNGAVCSNDEIYVLSSFGYRIRLNRTLKDDERFADPGQVSGGLVSYTGLDPAYHDRRSRTAVLLDSLAEVCVHRPGEVFAVGLVVPRSAASSTVAPPTGAPGATAAKTVMAPRLIVAANAGVPHETRLYLHKLLKKLQALAQVVILSEKPSGVDPDSRSPPPPVRDEKLLGESRAILVFVAG